MNPHRPKGAEKETSAMLTALIIQLRDKRGLSFAQIVARLSKDLSIDLSRAAVWQRYKRGKQ